MKAKKILCFSTSLGGGGAERQMVALIEGLNSKGIIPDVLNCRNSRNDYPTEAKMNRHFVITRFRIFEKLCLLWRIYQISPQVLLSFDGGPNLVAALYKFLFRNCKVVVSERNTSQKPLTFRSHILYWLYKYVDTIISNSKTQAEFLIKEYPDYQNKIKVITNYTDTDYYKPSKKSISNPIKIVVPARYAPQKNTIRFLKALSILNNDPLCPAFECEWWGLNESNGRISDYYKECEKIRNELDLNNVRLCGYNNRLLDIIHSADIVCLPSLYEGFSNALSEAISIGKPILASSVCDNPTFVKENWNGYLFDPMNIEDISYKIKLLLQEFSRYQEFGLNSRKLALNLFDKNLFIDSYLHELII